MIDTACFGLPHVYGMAILTDGHARSMRDENEPDYAADDKGQRSSDEYFLQYFHIYSLSE
jgi:hypothetical protein